MAYIEILAPRGYDPYALFIYPYKEGIRNLTDCANQPTLWESTKQAGVGLLLLIPVINTIAFMILRETVTVHIFNDAPKYIQRETIPEVLHDLNERRARAIDQRQWEEVADIEAEAVDHVELIHVDEVRDHLRLSERRDEDLTKLDGQIFDAHYKRTCVKQNGLPPASFTQVGGVHQYQGSNHLCGFYALFYMYQAVSGCNQFSSRDELHPLLVRWTGMIAKKRAQSWLSNSRNGNIPPALEVSVRGISRDDMHYLIKNDPDLECLRTNNCFVLGMDALHNQREEKRLWDQQQRQLKKEGQIRKITPYPSDVIQRLGNKRFEGFPLFFIMKESNLHYYFIWAENPWKFNVVHSLGSSIHNRLNFNDIVECLAREFQ